MNTHQANNESSKKIEEIYFSVDVEADGPIPGPYSMSSIGIVACAYRTNQNAFAPLDLDAPVNCFYAELKPISENFDPEAAAVSGLDRLTLLSDGTEPSKAMTDAKEFIETLAKRCETNGNAVRPVFVGWPLSYDWLWTYWYFMQYAGSSPFGHSSALDMKTMVATKTNKPLRRVGKRGLPKEIKSSRKHSHNALDDAREQGEMFNNISLWYPELLNGPLIER